MRLTNLVPMAAFGALACSNLGPTSPSSAPPLSASATDSTPRLTVSRTDLGTLGGRSSYATAINLGGTVVGWSLDASGNRRAFRWTAQGGMADLGSLPGDDWSQAISIADDGRILGVSGGSADPDGTAVEWSPTGDISALSIPLLPNADFGQARDFNPRGEVVGWDEITVQHAWIWSPSSGKYDITAHIPGGTQSAASEINSSGVVVGSNDAGTCRFIDTCWHAFLWSFQVGFQDLGVPDGSDGNTIVVGLGLNAAAAVVGWVNDPAIGQYPFRWSNGHFTRLPSALPYGYALSLNAYGTAVGANWDTGTGLIQPAVWPRSGGVVNLSQHDPYPGTAVAINDSGVVTGWLALDCCSGTNHAMVWRLAPGVRGLSPAIATKPLAPAAVELSGEGGGQPAVSPTPVSWYRRIGCFNASRAAHDHRCAGSVK